MADVKESRTPGLNLQLTNELQTLYTDPMLNISTKEIKTKKVDTLSVAPIGLFGYAFSCYIVGLLKLGIIQIDSVNSGIGLIFGGLCQYLIGFYDWYRGQSLSAFLDVGFGIFNMCFTFWSIFAAQGVADYPSNKANAYFCLIWAVTEIFVVIASYPGSKLSFICNIFVFLSFTVQTFGGFFNEEWITKFAGVILLIIATFMMYITFAILINSTFNRTILPLFVKGEKLECKITLRVNQ